jgi:hypothetical protein
VLGDTRDGEHPLRRLGGCGAREIAFVHLERGDAARGERGAQRLSSRSGGERGADDGSLHGEAGAEQLLDASHAFDHEKSLALARSAALEVAGKRK